jgi:hypothetical protein
MASLRRSIFTHNFSFHYKQKTYFFHAMEVGNGFVVNLLASFPKSAPRVEIIAI